MASRLGVYAGQMSIYDSNNINWYPIDVPDIPLTPEGTTYQSWNFSLLENQEVER